MEVATILPIITSVMLGVAGQLFIKSGVSCLGPISLGQGMLVATVGNLLTSSRLWVGFVLYGVSMLCWLAALAKVELSYAYPFISLSYVFILIASRVLFGERISPLRIFGVVAICFGVCMVAAR